MDWTGDPLDCVSVEAADRALAEARADERRKVIAELRSPAAFEAAHRAAVGVGIRSQSPRQLEAAINALASLLALEGVNAKVLPAESSADKPGITPGSPSPEQARAADDDWRTKRLHDLAERDPWSDPHALLARCLLCAEQERPPSGGLCADIEVVLGVAERPTRAHEEGSTNGTS